jgi:hypothetical protein
VVAEVTSIRPYELPCQSPPDRVILGRAQRGEIRWRARLPALVAGALWPLLHPVAASRPRILAALAWPFRACHTGTVGTPGFPPNPQGVPTGLPRQGSAIPCSVRSQRDDPGPQYRTGVVLSLSVVSALGLRVRCLACHATPVGSHAVDPIRIPGRTTSRRPLGCSGAPLGALRFKRRSCRLRATRTASRQGTHPRLVEWAVPDSLVPAGAPSLCSGCSQMPVSRPAPGNRNPDGGQ